MTFILSNVILMLPGSGKKFGTTNVHLFPTLSSRAEAERQNQPDISIPFVLRLSNQGCKGDRLGCRPARDASHQSLPLYLWEVGCLKVTGVTVPYVMDDTPRTELWHLSWDLDDLVIGEGPYENGSRLTLCRIIHPLQKNTSASIHKRIPMWNLNPQL